MTFKKYLVFVLSVIMLLSCKNTGEGKTGASAKNPKEKVTLHGTIKIYGNEPHTYPLLLCDDEKKYTIPVTLHNEMRSIQNEHYEFTGYIVKSEKKAGNFMTTAGEFTPLEYKKD